MKERQSRLKQIKTLIKNNSIESQDVLLSLLQKEGLSTIPKLSATIMVTKKDMNVDMAITSDSQEKNSVSY